MLIKLRDVASVIRSKNAGPYELTFDVLLKDDDAFRMIRDAGVINAKTISYLYGTNESDVISIVYFPNARAVKATVVRPFPSGAFGERDIYGAQQHAPLMEFEFDIDG